MLNDISVSFYDPNTSQEIQTKWCDLLNRSDKSPFLDWSWISSWLDSLPVLPSILEAKYNNKIIGLALICQAKKLVFPGIKIKQLWLHRFGQQEYDQIWIEHNDFLLDLNHSEAARIAMICFLDTHKDLWDEFYLGMATQNVVNLFSQNLPKKRIDLNSPNFVVDLHNKNELKDYLSDLSKNTRSQINRTKKILEQQGKLELVLATTKEEKLQAIEEISSLHQQKWGNTKFGSGFSNPKFVKFHKNMVLQYPNASCLYRMSLNEVSLAYIYLIKNDKKWYFYLSAMKNSEDNRIKIGLLAHALVIEDAIKHNINYYSFLAGEARYKRSMSNTPDSIQQLVCFYNPSFLLRTREKLRSLKRVFSRKPSSLTDIN